MTVITDYSTDVAKVRLLISDIDTDDPIFNDEAIQAFIDISLAGNIKRAAATALGTIATNEILVQKRIKLLDLSTDGPSEAKELRELAKQLRLEAEEEEIDGSFDWAEMIQTKAQYREFVEKDASRSG